MFQHEEGFLAGTRIPCFVLGFQYESDLNDFIRTQLECDPQVEIVCESHSRGLHEVTYVVRVHQNHDN